MPLRVRQARVRGAPALTGDAADPYATLAEPDRALLLDIHLRAREVVAAALAVHGRRPGLGAAIARARIAFLADELTLVTAAMERAGTPVDCRRGCCSCCTLMVEVTPDEAFALADHLAATLAPAALSETCRRAAENERRGGGLESEARHRLRLFCPALDRASGACLGHPVRPVPCQGYLSLDHKRCEADSLGPPVPILKPSGADLIRDAVMAARTIVLEDAGLDQSRRELAVALAAVWGDSESERRWLAGGSAFA